jgi:predicted cation transporter
MSLVFPVMVFKPLIFEYFTRVPSEVLYWVNMVSALLDNATLTVTAAEIGPTFSQLQVNAAHMGLLMAGGRRHADTGEYTGHHLGK